MPANLISSGAGTGAAGVTLNSAGATFLVTVMAWPTPTAVIGDNRAGNVWAAGDMHEIGGYRHRLFYCVNPTNVGANHTIGDADPNGSTATVHVYAFGGGPYTFGLQNGANDGTFSGTSCGTGGVTTTVDDALVIAGCLVAAGSGGGAVAGMTLGQVSGVGISAWTNKAVAGAVNPNFSWTANSRWASSIAAFYPVAPTLSGNVTLDPAVAAGSLGGASDLAGNIALDPVVAAGAFGLQPGTVVVPELRNWGGALQNGITVPRITALRLDNGVQVLVRNDVATHAVTGDISITDVALAAGTSYMVVGWNADGSMRFARPALAT